MDANSLDNLLKDGRARQFWLKPIGHPKDHPDYETDETRTWAQSEIEINFHQNPVKIAVGAVLIAYRVRYSTLIYVAERLPREEWSQEEVRSEYSRDRWPYHIKARNLTPEFGSEWKQYSIQPFPLADECNKLHPGEPARLGTILRGNDKATIPRWFAEFLIQRIREIPQRLKENSGIG